MKKNNSKFIIACFDYKCLIFDQANKVEIEKFFSKISDQKVFFVPGSVNEYQNIIKNHESNNEIFDDDINDFASEFQMSNSCGSSIIIFWNIIVRCLSGYLIKKCYYEIDKDRIKDFYSDDSKTKIKQKDELIFLHSIGITDSFLVNLCYIIEREELCVVKSFKNIKLEKREIKNYMSINYIFLPKLYGIIKDGNHELLVIEFYSKSSITKY